MKKPRLFRDPLGRLVFIDAAGIEHVDIHAIRAFPITAPNAGICLMDQSGKELCWFASLESIPESEQQCIQDELASREFMPAIEKIASVSSYATPSIWQIVTDRGQTRLRLKGEEDIRRIAGNALLISDTNGIQFLVRDLSKLDKHSRKLLDRFL